MSPRLAWNGYGKAAVRLVKVERNGPDHEVHDFTVDVQIQGDFIEAHLDGLNAAVLPTDTMKNAIYALAREYPVAPPEAFGARLAWHFTGACPAATSVGITITVHPWERVGSTAMIRSSTERRVAVVTLASGGTAVEAGLDGLGMLRTSGSAFGGFLRDHYTTLADASDRLMATDVSSRWRYDRAPEDWQAAWRDVRAALITTFSTHQSQSVQQTLYAMGVAALEACDAVSEIRLVLPNRHHNLVDLSPFGLDNPDQIYVATAEPYGRIEAVVAR
ncbi:MAG TPA: urate oxidase [Gemmatimonadales bacterium]|nr:urate oxidase [Gemmatimonadales bacterium]